MRELLAVPHDFYTALPQLADLTLENAAAISINRLQLLAQHSPNLTRLHFSRCVWTRDNSSLPLFPVDDITTALLTFSHLQYANLGVVPVSSDLMTPLIGELMGKTQLHYVPCDVPCSSCGEYHVW